MIWSASILTVALWCTITIDYPSCYYLHGSYDYGNKFIMLFEKNPYFGDACPLYEKKLAVNVRQGQRVEIYLDGKLYRVYEVERCY